MGGSGRAKIQSMGPDITFRFLSNQDEAKKN